MGFEIERKYLVKNDSYKILATAVYKIRQGYLSRIPERTVRVRILNDKGFITVKGITKDIIREEYEYEIPFNDAVSMLDICESPILSKTRYIVEFDGKRWEIDEFHGNNEGLVVAEIELNNKDEHFNIPEFIDCEVSDNPKYFNSNL